MGWICKLRRTISWPSCPSCCTSLSAQRLALAAVIAFYGLNGRRLTLTNDAAYDLIISVASGQLDTVDAIAAVLQTATGPRK